MRVKLGLTLREKCTLKAYENRVLKRIFGHKKDEVTGKWRNHIMTSA
jgi:hypothetical protein